MPPFLCKLPHAPCERPALLIAILTLLLPRTAACGADAGAELAPARAEIFTDAAWRVESDAGDRVELAVANGIVTVTYDVALARYHRVGHVSAIRGDFRLLLAKPRVLTPTEARIAFDAIGVDAGNSLRPLIEDASGERLSYEPHVSRMPLASGPPRPGSWARWSTRTFQAAEAGGATQNIFDADGGDGDAWPTGTLRFLGFEARLTKNAGNDKTGDRPADERRRGVFHIAGVRAAGVRVPDDDPTVFADALLHKAGRGRVGIEIADAFQATPYREESIELAFDPADPASRRQEIRFAVGAVKNAWIRCRADEADGTASLAEFRWEKNIPAGAAAVGKVDATQPPAIGAMRINTEAHTDGVYRPGEPLTVAVRIFDKAAKNAATLTWKLQPYGFEEEFERGSTPVTFSAGRADVSVPLSGAGRDAFELRLVLADAAGKTLEERSYVLGIARREAEAYRSRTGLLRDREFVKRASYVRSSYATEQKFKTSAEAIADIERMLDETLQVTPYVTYTMDLADFEILAGVYDFSLLDRVMDAAADRGCAVTIRISHGEMSHPFRWLPYTLPRNFDGAAITGHRFYGAFDYADQDYVAAWFRAFEMLHARYREHPAFQGYYILQPGGEWALPDEPWTGSFAGYTWADAELFRKYLREVRGFTLEQLADRWKTSLADWRDVQPPQPDFAIGKRPDLRPCWIDFSEFRTWFDHWWFPAVCRHIRSFDNDRVIIVYGGAQMNGEPEPELLGMVDYLHNGGNHFLEREGTLTDAWSEHALGWITEPHHPHRWAAYGDPAQKGWVLDWSVFVMTAQAGGGGANLHTYYVRNPTLALAAHYGGAFAFDRLEKFKPILRELHGTTLAQQPKQVAVMQDNLTLLLKHRTVFGARLADLRRWFDLLTLDSIDHEFYRGTNEKNYRLVLMNPLDEVVRPETIDAASRMARGGATLVLSARTGRLSPDADAEYPLLRALGIAPPTGRFVTDVAGLMASVKDDAAFLPRGARLAFFSQRDMRHELSDPAYGAGFWQWPYRWIPESDYFGFYAANTNTSGKVLATFPDGGAAVTLHDVGKGWAIVFWGTPDMKTGPLKGLMAGIAAAAGVTNPRTGNPIPLALEADHGSLKRHYALLYHETAGTYVQRLPGTPDGEWFIDDMVGGRRYGLFSGERLRTSGITLSFVEGESPLKILRMLPKQQVQADWVEKYSGFGVPN